MQIIIAENEIKEAITNYVLGQLSVREGQQVEVDLKATRGEAGFQAFINITSGSPQLQLQAKPEPVTTNQAPPTLKRVITTEDLKRMRAEEEAQEAAQEAAEEVIGAGPVDGTQPTSEPAEQAPAAQEEPAPATPATSSPPKRLFAGLVKPSNAA